MDIILLIIGFILLIKCADYFVTGCSNICKIFGIPSLIIGLTVVAFGTSAPELAVSVLASLKGANEISIGNVVGSNICNLLLVLGLSGLFGTVAAKKKIISRDYVYSLFAYLVLFIMTVGLFLDGSKTGVLPRSYGLILLCFFAIYLFSLIVDAKHSIKAKEEKGKFEIKDILIIIFSLAGIIVGGQLVVNASTAIARGLGISDTLIGLTIVAVGTSLPELVTSVVATKKGECDIALGNVIGSNIFNIFFILGVAITLSPMTLGVTALIDIIIMLASGILCFFFIKKNDRIGNKKGLIMLALYALYIFYIIVR